MNNWFVVGKFCGKLPNYRPDGAYIFFKKHLMPNDERIQSRK